MYLSCKEFIISILKQISVDNLLLKFADIVLSYLAKEDGCLL